MIDKFRILNKDEFLRYLFYTDKIYLYKRLFRDNEISYDLLKKHLNICREQADIRCGTIHFFKYLHQKMRSFEGRINNVLEKYICGDIIREIIKIL